MDLDQFKIKETYNHRNSKFSGGIIQSNIYQFPILIKIDLWNLFLAEAESSTIPYLNLFYRFNQIIQKYGIFDVITYSIEYYNEVKI